MCLKLITNVVTHKILLSTLQRVKTQINLFCKIMLNLTSCHKTTGQEKYLNVYVFLDLMRSTSPKRMLELWLGI
jgi:hypothetical protein